MDVIFSQLVNGIVTGCTYALVATGFNLLLLVCGIIHFAFPSAILLLMYLMWLVFQLTGSTMLMIVTAIVGGPILFLLSEPLFRPLVARGATMQTFIMSLAIGIVINFLTSQVINSGYPVSFADSLASRDAAFSIGLMSIAWGQLLIVFGSVAFVAALFVFLYKTMPGRALRAVALNSEIARLVGIEERKTATMAYAIGGLIAGVSAVFLTMSAGSAYNGLGELLSLKMIAVVLFAGSGNLVGGLLAALVLGMAETFVVGFASGQWSNAVAFGMILAVVMVRPQGMFGSKV